MTSSEPGDQSLEPSGQAWFSLLSPLSRSLSAMDQAILTLYKERGLTSFRSNWTPVLLTLADGGRTITELAALHRVKHASMSQRIAGMTTAGLVQSEPGEDARTRVITLTEHGTATLDFARREWDATEAAFAELDQELDGQLSEVGSRLARALTDRPFADRLRDRLPSSPT